jgi:hypothetical protein
MLSLLRGFLALALVVVIAFLTNAAVQSSPEPGPENKEEWLAKALGSSAKIAQVTLEVLDGYKEPNQLDRHASWNVLQLKLEKIHDNGVREFTGRLWNAGGTGAPSTVFLWATITHETILQPVEGPRMCNIHVYGYENNEPLFRLWIGGKGTSVHSVRINYIAVP